MKAFLYLLCLTSTGTILYAQRSQESPPDLSNKTLVTKSAPPLAEVAALRKMANEFYAWRNEAFPVSSSESGLHTWDDRMTDFTPAKIAEREKYVRALLDKVRALKTDTWPKDDRIDWLLFRAQLEQFDFGSRVLKSTEKNPQLYIGECVSGIFSLLKKEYDAPAKRARSATARLKQMPALLKQGLSNLQSPVKLYAQLAAQSARAIDPLLGAV